MWMNMNYKLEKFWNTKPPNILWCNSLMNYKLEKFWNSQYLSIASSPASWTINLKSFEMEIKKIFLLIILYEL